jgi:hypothetical protein
MGDSSEASVYLYGCENCNFKCEDFEITTKHVQQCMVTISNPPAEPGSSNEAHESENIYN